MDTNPAGVRARLVEVNPEEGLIVTHLCSLPLTGQARWAYPKCPNVADRCVVWDGGRRWACEAHIARDEERLLAEARKKISASGNGRRFDPPDMSGWTVRQVAVLSAIAQSR